ncbi:MAG: hypothetical protein JOZ18_09550 [Chloroflexi bacterium]|nr:hypothetical protein [Chloroflexota bacterium]
MCKEAIALQESVYTTNVYTYKLVDTVQDVVAMMQLVSATRAEQIALVTITLHFKYERKAYPGQLADVHQSARYILDNLRPLVRKTDVVLLSGNTFYFILLGANLQGGKIVQTRLWDALLWRVHNINDGDVQRPYAMSIGHSAYPEPCSDIDECITMACEVRESFGVYSERGGRKPGSPQNKDEELPALARKLGIPYLSLLPRKLPEKVQQLVSPRLAQELRCYPLGRERDVLTVAMSNPQDGDALDRLRRETGLHIFPVLTHPNELETALEGYLVG